MAGGVAVIRVGAATETEMKEEKLRMEDALNATRAAVEEGIIAGGGSAYIHVTTQLAELIDSLDGDEKIGARIVQKALEAPLFHIVTNAGLEGAVVINKVKESKVGVGFDAYNEEYVDMIQAGILDPVKVTRSALQNATSVSATLLTTESVVSTIKEPAPAMPAGADGFLVESFSSISHGSESLQKISESFHAFAGRRIWTLPAFYAILICRMLGEIQQRRRNTHGKSL